MVKDKAASGKLRPKPKKRVNRVNCTKCDMQNVWINFMKIKQLFGTEKLLQIYCRWVVVASCENRQELKQKISTNSINLLNGTTKLFQKHQISKMQSDCDEKKSLVSHCCYNHNVVARMKKNKPQWYQICSLQNNINKLKHTLKYQQSSGVYVFWYH